MCMRKILVVDPEEPIRNKLADVLRGEGYHNVIFASCSSDAITSAVEDAPEIILLDKRCPEMDGEDAAKIITEKNPSAIVFLMAYNPKTSENLTFILSGAKRFLDKSDLNFLSNLIKSLAWAVQLLDLSDQHKKYQY